jgi:UrcA family protein
LVRAAIGSEENSMKAITGLTLAVVASLVVGTTAYAAALESVTVTGSRAISETDVGRTPTGVPIKEVSLSYTVKIGDLDPKTAAGKAEIEKRVTSAAKAACTEIDKLASGPTSPDDATCVRQAVKDAMAKVK